MEQTYSDTSVEGWVTRQALEESRDTRDVVEKAEQDAIRKANGLNGIHMDSLLRVLNKLDKVVERDGTHIVDEAKFAVYDGNGEAVHVLIGFDPELSLHYFIGVEA